MIRLLVGLGNPGPEYEGTRHNAGFGWIDALARQWGVTLHPERAYHGLAARPTRHGHTVWLLEPQTYMNLSGKSVGALARFFKIAPEEILVVHDELDLPPGQAKLKQGGSAAGHNGLKDIQAQLGSPDFWRLRLGIGHPGDRAEVAAYVLRRAPEAERRALEDSIQRSLGAVESFLSGDMGRAVSLVHARPERPKPPRPDPAPRSPRQPDQVAAVVPANSPPASTAPAP